mmetsp:Transcript_956/g.4241  ORF Transcript_956/g.4241 Transcript_956/m.4241 type:complete len:240 (+) Transcript_956:779-1498(+)
MPSRRIHAFISPSFALGPSPTSSSSSRPAALSAAASSLFLAISAIAASSTARAWLRDHPSAHPSPPTEARPLGNRSLETTFSCVPWEDDPPPGASVSRRTRAMIAPASTEPIHPLSLSTHPRTAVSAPPSAPSVFTAVRTRGGGKDTTKPSASIGGGSRGGYSATAAASRAASIFSTSDGSNPSLTASMAARRFFLRDAVPLGTHVARFSCASFIAADLTRVGDAPAALRLRTTSSWAS